MTITLLVNVKGGAGSGNWGHAGRPGMVGGSGGTGGVRLTQLEVQAIHDYSWLTSQTINDELREDKVSTNKPFGGMSRAEQVDLLDSAISKAPALRDNTVLYSMMDAIYLKRDGLLEPGSVVSVPGYISATDVRGGVRSYPGQEFTMRAVLKLTLPKGAKGVLPIATVSHYPQEHEHMIARGSKYIIRDVTMPDNPYIDPVEINAEIVD